MTFTTARARLVCAFALALFMLALCARPTLAHEYKAGPLTIVHPHARATIPGRPVAGYMTIVNDGEAADRVVGARSALAERIEIHTHLMEDGVMKMRPVEAVDVPARGEAAFAPGGFHLMMFGIDPLPAADETIPVTVTFENAGEITMDFVIDANAGSPADHSGHGAAN